MTTLTIVDAVQLAPHRLMLTFSDGRSGRLDFLDLLDDDLPPPFVSLRDPVNFSGWRLSEGTLHWLPDLDLAPEYIYFRTFRDERALHQRFIDWGYLQTR